MVVHEAENVKRAQRGVFNKIKEKTMDNITAQIAITSWTLPEDSEEPCPENFQKSRSEYSIEKGIE